MWVLALFWSLTFLLLQFQWCSLSLVVFDSGHVHVTRDGTALKAASCQLG